MASLMPSVAGLAISTASRFIPALFRPYSRSIGGIIAQVTIEEQATDELHITDHPVEQGAPISDHAFKVPVTLTINAGWSSAWIGDLSAESGIYGFLLALQAMLIPFDVVTGKRTFSNMLIQRLVVTTDEKSEYALMAQIECRQVIIVGTQTVEVSSMSSNPQDQQSPQQTAPPANNGPQQTPTPSPTVAKQADVTAANNDAGSGGLNEKGIDTSSTAVA
jgi:hypothetical protein